MKRCEHLDDKSDCDWYMPKNDACSYLRANINDGVCTAPWGPKDFEDKQDGKETK